MDIIGKDPEKWRPQDARDGRPQPAVLHGRGPGGRRRDRRPVRAQRASPIRRLLELVAKIKIHRDAALSARYPRGIPNRLTVTLADGRQLVKEVEFPRGHADNPMTDAEVEHKFRTLVEPRYGKAKADAILAACWESGEADKRGGVGAVGGQPQGMNENRRAAVPLRLPVPAVIMEGSQPEDSL